MQVLENSDMPSNIVGGSSHCHFLDVWGCIYGWGSAISNGHGEEHSSISPIKALKDEVFSSVSAGRQFTLAVTVDGKLFGWGCMVHLELTALPSLIVSKGVVSCASGASHAVYMLCDGTLWTAGSNRHGQVGHAMESGKNAFDHLPLPNGFTLISPKCSDECTFAFVREDVSGETLILYRGMTLMHHADDDLKDDGWMRHECSFEEFVCCDFYASSGGIMTIVRERANESESD